MVIPKSHSFTIDQGGNVYTSSNQEDADPKVVDNPVDAGISIRHGFLEQSNVNLATEMTELIN